MRLKVVASLSAAGGSAASALWTFPSILLSAFLVAWGAEAAQFLISQGVALALLAWLQTLPEFAVEAVIAWEAGKDPTRTHLAIANLTGAIRLLLGLGWPMIYFVFAFYGRHKAEQRFPAIHLDKEHAVEVVGLVPPLLYFIVILWKARFSWVDAVVLILLYVAYLWVLFKNPPHAAEKIAEAPVVSRWAYGQPGWRRPAAIAGLFLVGGALLYLTAHPFLESMLALAASWGVSQFVFVQWVAPFLSEFPEKLSAFYWARRVSHAPMALMNMVSSNVNQWTVLAAMIPLVYGYSHWRHTGTFAPFHFDASQRLEIVLTLMQSALALVILAKMRFTWFDASGIFVLWAVQFFVPHWRVEIALCYGAWLAVLLGGYLVRTEVPPALVEFARIVRGPRGGPKTRSAGAA